MSSGECRDFVITAEASPSREQTFRSVPLKSGTADFSRHPAAPACSGKGGILQHRKSRAEPLR